MAADTEELKHLISQTDMRTELEAIQEAGHHPLTIVDELGSEASAQVFHPAEAPQSSNEMVAKSNSNRRT